MTKQVKFNDSVIISQPIASDSLKTDAQTILARDKNPRLKVQIDATHSGVIINNRVYPGRYVKDGYLSFFSKDGGGSAQYDKPILKHHDMYSDPIGRVVKAEYKQLKFGYDFENDFILPDTNGKQGSGVVTIDGIITDPESITKVLDSRYLSVSAGHSSPVLLCSTCGDSMFSCEHYPGEKYDAEGEPDEDGMPCYAITGPMTYHEVSFVNLPASPAAKLVNFSWEDSKDSWGKDKIITAQVQAKKDTVRSFLLCDEDSELNLLNGKSTSTVKKTMIAVSPAIADKLKHVMSSDHPKTDDETANVRQPSEENKSGVLNVEQDLDKAINSGDEPEKETEMDAEKITQLESELASLKDELATSKTKVSDLEKDIQAKDSQIQRLIADAEGMQEKMAGTLAVSLASLRTRFGKQLPKGEDGKEPITTEQYIEKLSKRSVESLQDSLQDLMLEIDQLPQQKVETQNTPINDLVKGDKVQDPTPRSKGATPKENTKTETPKRAVDVLSKGLGL